MRSILIVMVLMVSFCSYSLSILRAQELSIILNTTGAKSDLTIDNERLCSTEELEGHFFTKYSIDKFNGDNDTLSVFIQLEVDYHTYLDFGRDTVLIQSWVQAIFQQTAHIYAQHGIQLQLYHLVIHEEEDIYYTNYSLKKALKLLAQTYMFEKRGDVIMLMSTKNMGGGKANIQSLCTPIDSSQGQGPLAVLSGLSLTAPSSSSYSWNTYLFAHELGHILGSPHTHACAWGPNFDRTLDNCFAPESNCISGNSPQNGGTIMSYCNMTSNGINFAHGLGFEPALRIRQSIKNASCLVKTAEANACTPDSSCDDGNTCTIEDTYNQDCQCVGQLLDMNLNGICDFVEPCPDQLEVTYIDQSSSSFIASSKITVYLMTPLSLNVVLSSAGEIVISPGFELTLGTEFNTYNYGCTNQ